MVKHFTLLGVVTDQGMMNGQIAKIHGDGTMGLLEVHLITA